MGDDRRHSVHLRAAIGFLVQLCDSVTNYNNAVLPYYSLPRRERARTREDDDSSCGSSGLAMSLFSTAFALTHHRKGHVSPKSTE